MSTSAKHRRPTHMSRHLRRSGALTAGALLAAGAFAPAAAAGTVDPEPKPAVQSQGNEVESSEWDQNSWQSYEWDDIDADDDSEGGEGATGGSGGNTGVQCQSNSLVDLASLLQDGVLAPGSLIPVGSVEDGDEAPRNVCGAETDNDGGDGGNGGGGDD